MAKPQKRPKPITFVLTPTQRDRLKKIGLRKRQGILLRAKISKNGRLVVTHHKKIAGGFVASNAAFA